jgi:hypothetical protein
MSKHVNNPRFFIYENKEVKEVTENEYYAWACSTWNPGHLKHAPVPGCRDEIYLGFQGHYKYCNWIGKPFNVTYFIYGSDYAWQDAIEEFYDTYEEAEERFHQLATAGFCEKSAHLKQAA